MILCSTRNLPADGERRGGQWAQTFVVTPKYRIYLSSDYLTCTHPPPPPAQGSVSSHGQQTPTTLTTTRGRGKSMCQCALRGQTGRPHHPLTRPPTCCFVDFAGPMTPGPLAPSAASSIVLYRAAQTKTWGDGAAYCRWHLPPLFVDVKGNLRDHPDMTRSGQHRVLSSKPLPESQSPRSSRALASSQHVPQLLRAHEDGIYAHWSIPTPFRMLQTLSFCH